MMITIVKIIVTMMMIDKDGIPKEAQNERSNNMEPGNNREEISEKRLLEVKCGGIRLQRCIGIIASLD